jgi:hypothetical protein
MSIDYGVKGYIKGRVTLEVNFPIDDRDKEYLSCSMCIYYSKYDNKCKLNGGVCYFPTTHIAPTCPLEFEFDKKENEE